MVSRHKKRATLGPYLLLSTLGKGEFAKVKLGIHSESGQKVAIKLIKINDMDRSRRIRVDREIEVLKTVSHPNIIKMHSVIETKKTIGIILECASGGELFDYINNFRRLQESEARRLFTQLADGVHYLHQRHIIHRDLKLENLLLDRQHNLLIIDFGFAYLGGQQDNDDGKKQKPSARLLETACGSPCYAAPELVLTEDGYKGPAADIWSCGVILYAILCGHLPYQDDNIHQLYRTMVSHPPEFPDHVSASARDLIQKMMMPDPEDRCSMATVLSHPWLQHKPVSAPRSRLGSNNTLSCPALGALSHNYASRPQSLPAASSAQSSRKAQSLQQQEATRKPLFVLAWLLRKRRGGASNNDRPRTYRGTVPQVDQQHIIASARPHDVIAELKHISTLMGACVKEERAFKLKCVIPHTDEKQLQQAPVSSLRAFLQRRHQRDHKDNLCMQQEIRFNIELCQIEDLPQLYVVDIRRVHGNTPAFSNLRTNLLTNFHAKRSVYR